MMNTEKLDLLQSIAIETESNDIATDAIEAISNYIDAPKAITVLHTIIFKAKTESAAVKATEAILEKFHYLTETFSIGSNLALFPPSYGVGKAAIEGISKYFANQITTKELLLKIALMPSSNGIGKIAINCLIKYFFNKQEYLFVLEEIALETSSEGVGKIALENILEFENNQNLIPCLANIAVKAQSKGLRLEAMEIIYRVSRNHPEVIRLNFLPEPTYIYRGVNLPEKYANIPVEYWQSEWLLTEKNSEVRRALIQGIGYDKIYRDLKAVTLDNYREYTLIKIDNDIDFEPILILKMVCSSTGYNHFLRVPPTIKSAKEAIIWINWGIDPEKFMFET